MVQPRAASAVFNLTQLPMNTASSFRALRLLTTAMLACMISSCALPPREAMRIVQREGLISYLSRDYSSGYAGGPAYASAAPFQTSRAPYLEPRPVNPIPYRTTYHTNRYSKADYNRVPYRPKTVTRQSSSRSSSPRRSATITEEAPERPVVRTESHNNNKPADTTASVTPEAPKKPTAESLPYGTPVAGRPGMVTSPFAQKQQLVDVTGLAPGDTVKDPYSGKLFRVPPTQQAAAESKPATEPPPAEKPAAPSTPDAPKP